MMLAILCSGQGAQDATMFDLTGGLPQAEGLFAHATRLLGEDPRDLVRRADSKTLQENRAAQILCTLQSLAAAVLCAASWPARCCIAGYSVGELASWSLAGRIDPLDALDLADARARAMDAARHGDEGMAFVRGLTRGCVELLCSAHGVEIAIANPGNAFVIAGDRAGLVAFALAANASGAQRIAPIGVRIASHTSRLAAAVPVFRAALSHTKLLHGQLHGTRLMSGIDGLPVFDVENGLDKLAGQIAQTVEWETCLAACVEAGATAFLELGPGQALADMAVAAYPQIPARSLAAFRSPDAVQTWIKRSTA
jgi:[acyl-carrier-protein] S-malonyltransferase